MTVASTGHSHCHSLLPTQVEGILHLPGSPAPSRAQDAQPWLSAAGMEILSQLSLLTSFLRSIFALSLLFLLFGGI